MPTPAAELVLTGRDIFSGEPLRLSVAGGMIAAIVPAAPGDVPDDLWIAPGLVDLQVNGFRGVDFNAPGLTPVDVAALAQAMAAVGVTTFLPTLITASEARLTAALSVIASARRADPALAHVMPFVHLEGPWISPQDGARGAHPEGEVRPPDLDEFDRLQAACGGLIGMVTMSPHWQDAPVVIAALVARGVRVALGHTHAGPAEIAAAVAAGASLSTHLGNGIPALLPRHPNAIWSQLAEDGLTKTFIADGHHLPADAFRAMLRAAGLERSILVSDVVALGGMSPGFYDSPIGGRVELSADGRLSVAGTPYLAGAALPLIDCIPRAMAMARIGLAEAIRLASVNPGRIVGGRGHLAVGARADLIAFRWRAGETRLRLAMVIGAGKNQPAA